MISNFKNCQRVFLQVHIPRIPNRVPLVGGGNIFGKMAKNCMKITNPTFLGQNSRLTWGDKAIFWVGGIPPCLPVGKPAFSNPKCTNFKFMSLWLPGFSCIMTLKESKAFIDDICVEIYSCLFNVYLRQDFFLISLLWGACFLCSVLHTVLLICSVRDSPRQSANAKAFAKAYLHFTVVASAIKLPRQLNS